MKEMIETKRPSVTSNKQKVILTNEGVTGQLVSDTVSPNYGADSYRHDIPDMLAYIQGKTELTRTTTLDSVKKSAKISELLMNPQMFMDNTTSTIKSVLMN